MTFLIPTSTTPAVNNDFLLEVSHLLAAGGSPAHSRICATRGRSALGTPVYCHTALSTPRWFSRISYVTSGNTSSTSAATLSNPTHPGVRLRVNPGPLGFFNAVERSAFGREPPGGWCANNSCRYFKASVSERSRLPWHALSPRGPRSRSVL
jgi:hypothetical protein